MHVACVIALVLLGPPGGGKGTQGRLLAEDLRVPWLSSGALLRDAVREGTEVGRRVERSLQRGELVDDEEMLEVMGERLRSADATGGFILDGFPRTRTQGEGLAHALERIGVALSCALLLDVSDDEVIGRLAARQRDDDRPETIRRRLAVYHRETEPLVDFYEQAGLLRRVDGCGSPEDVHGRLEAELASIAG
jgi:adenylate kinase